MVTVVTVVTWSSLCALPVLRILLALAARVLLAMEGGQGVTRRQWQWRIESAWTAGPVALNSLGRGSGGGRRRSGATRRFKQGVGRSCDRSAPCRR